MSPEKSVDVGARQWRMLLASALALHLKALAIGIVVVEVAYGLRIVNSRTSPAQVPVRAIEWRGR